MCVQHDVTYLIPEVLLDDIIPDPKWLHEPSACLPLDDMYGPSVFQLLECCAGAFAFSALRHCCQDREDCFQEIKPPVTNKAPWCVPVSLLWYVVCSAQVL